MKKSAKGFTMMEMIIVVAIIGILSGVLAPAMASYIRKSRISQQESNARTVYNAVQTQLQEFQFMERGEPVQYLNVPLKVTCEYDELVDVAALESGVFVAKTATSDPELWAMCEDIVETVGGLFSDQESACWSVYFDNYVVHASASANSMFNRNVGFCPKLGSKVFKDPNDPNDPPKLTNHSMDRFELTDHTISSISKPGSVVDPNGEYSTDPKADYLVNDVAW